MKIMMRNKGNNNNNDNGNNSDIDDINNNDSNNDNNNSNNNDNNNNNNNENSDDNIYNNYDNDINSDDHNDPPSIEYEFLVSASLLLDNLLSYLTSSDKHTCKAVYLHVLTTNVTAIHFYERRSFRLHSFLPYYYSIKGSPRDGFSYVLYINGGQPPWTVLYPFYLLYLTCLCLEFVLKSFSGIYLIFVDDL